MGRSARALVRFLAVLVLGFLFLSFSPIVAASEIPAPFESAKQLAMKATPDENGRFIVELPGRITGTEVIFILGYIPDFDTIGIGVISTEGDIFVVQYNEMDGSFSTYENGYERPCKPEVAIEVAFKIFSFMVAGKVI